MSLILHHYQDSLAAYSTPFVFSYTSQKPPMSSRRDFARSPAPSRSPEPGRGSTSSEAIGRIDLNGWSTSELEHYGALSLRGQDCRFGDLDDIHLLFQRGNFTCTDFEYASIRRALCLASQFLYEPVASVFYYSLVFGPRKPVPHIVNTPGGGTRDATEDPWSSFSAVPVGPAEMAQLSVFWEQMQHSISFDFIDIGTISGEPCSAITIGEQWDPTRGPQGTLMGGRRTARTSLSRRFPDSLGPLQAGQPPPEDIAYALREDYILAITILHELSHAIHMVRMGGMQLVAEPFFEDMRDAELGFAWEQTVVNGRLSTVNHQDMATARLGLYFTMWPNTLYAEEQPFVGKFPVGLDDLLLRRFGRRQWETGYLVMMEHMQRLAFYRGWLHVARYGSEGLKMEKLVGRRLGRFDAWARALAQSSGGDSMSWGSSGIGDDMLVIRNPALRRKRRSNSGGGRRAPGTRRPRAA